MTPKLNQDKSYLSALAKQNDPRELVNPELNKSIYKSYFSFDKFLDKNDDYSSEMHSYWLQHGGKLSSCKFR